MPACREYPIPTPPPWCTETQVAPDDCVQEGVEHRPVGNGIAAVPHALGLPVWRGDRAGIEMITADHDRRLDDAATDQLVDRQAEARPLAVTKPEDSSGESLEGDAFGRQPDPAAQRLVVGEHFEARARRSRRCRPDHPRALPTGTGPCRGRRADGCIRARSPGCRRRSGRLPSRPVRGCCCRSRK